MDCFMALAQEAAVKLLTAVAVDYNLDVDELLQKYLKDAAPISHKVEKKPRKTKKVKETTDDEDEKPAKPEKVKCSGVTKAGKPCKNSPCGGGCFCRVHTPKEKEDEEEEKPKKKKKVAKKKVAKHDHEIAEECGSECEMAAHGTPEESVGSVQLSGMSEKRRKIAAIMGEEMGMEFDPTEVPQEMLDTYDD
jgi:hypothetical protein